jgi:hypothetical protein
MSYLSEQRAWRTPGPHTYKDLMHEVLVDVVHISIGGSPWGDDVEDALRRFHARIDREIENEPVLAELLNAHLRHEKRFASS